MILITWLSNCSSGMIVKNSWGDGGNEEPDHIDRLRQGLALLPLTFWGLEN
jgi:hypothetical protein